MIATDVCILIVDDDPLLLETIAFLFQQFKFQVDTATCGDDAWALVEKKSYHLVLTDVRMANGDGIELTKKIMARGGKRPSVLFMSGFTDLLNEEIYHVGGEGKFTKPFDTRAVRSAIETCMLAPEAKWKQPLVVSGGLKIEKAGLSVAALEAEKSIVFGRGGFFISHAFAPPEKGSNVHFLIKIEQPEPFTLKGTGVIRWIQSHGKSNIPPGLGIEITNMDSANAKLYAEMFGELIPFIPSLNRMHSGDGA